MRIYSMTATFGKLENQTLTLQPGLNVIHAPNEWGKSTWCAFLVSMLYGISTKERTTANALADKEHYAPWSGAPMSGRIDLNWNGRDITIERSSKGRVIFGEFSAYETATGMPIPELTASNCGQQLLGVEKSVFTHAGFIRQSDMPVTEDDALRRRLNALVTTGDDSGASDLLLQKLKDLKNRCRHNKTGLLPQAEGEKAAITEKLQQLTAYQQQLTALEAEQTRLEQLQADLENHRQALDYADNRSYADKLAKAQISVTIAQTRVEELTAQCAALPTLEEIELSLGKLQQLREAKDALQTDAQLLSAPPVAPVIPLPYQNLTREEALQQAKMDYQSYTKTHAQARRRWPGFVALAIAAACLGCLAIPHWIGILLAILGAAAGMILFAFNQASCRRAQDTKTTLEMKYAPIAASQWEAAAAGWADAQASYIESSAQYHLQKDALEHRAAQLRQDTEALTKGLSVVQQELNLRQAKAAWHSLDDAKKELQRADLLAQTLSGSQKEILPPEKLDSLTYDREETLQKIAQCRFDREQLHKQQGQLSGLMEGLGSQVHLGNQLSLVEQRIEKLEKIYNATCLALDTVTETAHALQRRFAPRISGRAQTLFSRFTQNKYHRLTLQADFSMHTGAEAENTLHSVLWRSDGTADQLYLALRLAVAEELTPNAPLVLDDALCRFDDTRAAIALDVLREAAAGKQVILFTCQSREETLLGS